MTSQAGSEWPADKRYGRRGGHYSHHRKVDIENAPPCSVCDGRMVCGQPGRHWVCSPTCEGCRRPIGPRRENCQCKRG